MTTNLFSNASNPSTQFFARVSPSSPIPFVLKASLAALSAISFTQVSAQTKVTDNADNPPVLPTVVVTASRLPQTLADTQANTSVITRADIERSVATDLPALLASQAGVEFGRNGNYGQLSSIFMRGLSSNKVLLLIDGVPYNNQNDGTPRVELIPLDMVERIEVVRGNVSAQYGSNAVGGVIQIFSRQGAAKGLVINTEIGSQGHRKASAVLSIGSDSTTILLNTSRLTANGVSAVDTSIAPTANPDNDGIKQITGQLSVTHRFSSDVKLGLQGMTTEQNSAYDDPDYPAVPTDIHIVKRRLNNATAWIDAKIIPIWNVNFKVNQQHERERNDLNGSKFSDSDSTRQFYSLQNTIDLNRLGLVHLGMETERLGYMGDNGYGSLTTSVARSTQAFLAGWQGQASAFAWNLNVRQDRSDKESVPTYFAGLSYAISKEWSIRTSNSTAFVRPSLGQIYSSSYGNLNLLAERSKNQELGLQWDSGDSLVRLTHYQSNVRNMISSDSMGRNININQVKNRGFELIAETQMPWAGGKLRASANTFDPYYVSNNSPILRRAKIQANLAVSGKTGNFSWDASLQQKGNREDIDISTYAPTIDKAFTKLDAKFAYTLNKNWSANLSLININNAKDNTAHGYSGTPRGWILGLQAKL